MTLASSVKASAPQHAAFDSAALCAGAVSAFTQAEVMTVPFRYWLVEHLLPPQVCEELIKLPIKPSGIRETYGKRDSHNEVRRFFSPEMRAEFPVMQAVGEVFQHNDVVRALEAACGVSFTGSYLRIEYCQDVDGFWLEPHMDIKEKRITLQLYLNNDEDAATLGTDLYDKSKQRHSAPDGTIGKAMMFIPAEPESWHGFEKRPIKSIRRSLIINYVTDDWRARHELTFPQQPVQ